MNNRFHLADILTENPVYAGRMYVVHEPLPTSSVDDWLAHTVSLWLRHPFRRLHLARWKKDEAHRTRRRAPAPRARDG